jgi:hypothetical protein
VYGLTDGTFVGQAKIDKKKFICVGFYRNFCFYYSGDGLTPTASAACRSVWPWAVAIHDFLITFGNQNASGNLCSI